MSRQRTTIAVICIALVVFSAFLPAGSDSVWATLTALWLIVPAAVVTVIAREASRSEERPASLLSLVLLRAPPPPSSIA